MPIGGFSPEIKWVRAFALNWPKSFSR